MPHRAAALLIAVLAATACARGGQGAVPADPIREEVEPARAEDLEGGVGVARGADASDAGDASEDEESLGEEPDGAGEEPAPDEEDGGEEELGGGVDLGGEDEIEIEIDEE